MDNVNSPSHYNSHPSGVECIDIVKHMSFPLGSAIKYIWRAGLKGDAVEDLLKAQRMLDIEIDRLSKPAPPVKPPYDLDGYFTVQEWRAANPPLTGGQA